MGPNFIYFGGQKYGYRPIPTDIITSELAKLREVRLNQIQRGQGFSIKEDVNCTLTEIQGGWPAPPKTGMLECGILSGTTKHNFFYMD